MARSIAAPAPTRHLGRRSRRPRLPPAPTTRSLPWPLGAAGNAAGSALEALRGVLATVWRRRRLRIALIAALVAVPLLGGGWLWLRNSPLVSVEHVRIEGLAGGQGMERGAIETALTGAARRMSTLDVKPAALLAAVAQYPIVKAVRARARVPHGLDIEVVEQLPVAALQVGAARTAVAADGVVLGPAYLSPGLPLAHPVTSVQTSVQASAGTAPGGATAHAASTRNAFEPVPAVGHGIRSGTVLAELAALGAAPGPLAKEVENVYFGSRGLTIAFEGGLVAYFGDATRAHAKWLALARVLADPGSAGAAYVDVRLPERPAAGFPPGTVAPDGSSTEAGQPSGADPSASELAAGLDAAVSGATSTSTGAGTAGSSEPGSGAAGTPGSSEPGSGVAAATGSAEPGSAAAGTTGAAESGSASGDAAGAGTEASG